MGGNARYDFPRHVWTPMGGWWCNPRGWQRSTAVAVVGIAVASAALVSYVEKNTVHT